MPPRDKQPSIVSCDKCRSLKVKCIRLDAQATCVKCTKSGHRCSTTERPSNRNQKVPLKRVRLRDLASRLDDVLGPLTSSDGARSTWNTDGETSSATPPRTTTSVDVEQDVAEDAIVHTRSDEQYETSSASMSRANWADRLILDHWLLGHLLQRYRIMQHHFPFVVVPEAWSVQYMLMSRPTLLLAIASSSACHYPHLQQILVKELKSTLTHRVMVADENNLELLQAILIHLAWSQYHMVPRSLLNFRYLQVAVSMAVDLHLDSDPSIVARQSELFAIKMSTQSRCFESYDRSNEAFRAALGCFYLSSVLTSSMMKPNTLPFSDSTLAWATSLAQHAEVPTDSSIILMIQYQQLLGDFLDVYQAERKTGDLSRLALHAKRMITVLENWWLSVPRHLHLTNLFAKRYHYAKLRIYEMGLPFHFRTHDESLVSATGATTLSTNLLSCVDAIKNYLDTLLAADGPDWDTLPCEEWSRSIVAFFVLYKLAAGPREIQDWDVDMCRASIDLPKYLNAVAGCLSRSSQSLEATPCPTEGLYFVLPDILRSARSSYLLARDAPHLVKPGDRVHMDLSKDQVLTEVARPKNQRRCPATSFWTDRALVLDQETDWRKVDLTNILDPAAQLAQNERLWNDLLGVDGISDSH